MKITDKIRLDWLSKRTTGSNVPEIFEARISHSRSEPAYTLRQAIDAAIRAEKRGRKA